MAVYQMYFYGMQEKSTIGSLYATTDLPAGDYNHFAYLKQALEEREDTFLFIITKRQWGAWSEMYEKYGYKEYTLFEMPYFVTNWRYGHNESGAHQGGRKLRLVILKGKGNKQ
jgi:hypothetical protein